MAEHIRLVRMKLPQLTMNKLNKNGILDTKGLFRRNQMELIEMGFSKNEVDEMFSQVSRMVSPKPQSVLSMINEQRKDHVHLSLGGKTEASLTVQQGLTELVGGAGMGKTQACMTLAVQAAVLHRQGDRFAGVVYIDSESAFSPSRLVEIAQNSYPAIFNTDDSITKLMSSILVFRENSTQKLLNRVTQLESLIIENDVKLIVVDSIASPVRVEFSNESLPQRQAILSQIASGLKYTGETFGIPSVVTNQVLSSYSSTGNVSASTSAALGVSWAHAVNTRFILNESGDRSKVITVAKSPRFPMRSFPYMIGQSGFSVLPTNS